MRILLITFIIYGTLSDDHRTHHHSKNVGAISDTFQVQDDELPRTTRESGYYAFRNYSERDCFRNKL